MQGLSIAVARLDSQGRRRLNSRGRRSRHVRLQGNSGRRFRKKNCRRSSLARRWGRTAHGRSSPARSPLRRGRSARPARPIRRSSLA